VALSNAPVWESGRLEPRPISLRVYVAAGPDGFVVMPGGLARTTQPGDAQVSMQSGGGSKDTWVLGGETASPSQPASSSNVVLLPETAARRLSPGTLPSRVADSLYWTGRYAERAIGAVRLLRAIVSGVTD